MKKNGLVKDGACDRTKRQGMLKAMTTQNPENSVDTDNACFQNEMMNCVIALC